MMRQKEHACLCVPLYASTHVSVYVCACVCESIYVRMWVCIDGFGSCRVVHMYRGVPARPTIVRDTDTRPISGPVYGKATEVCERHRIT